MSGYFRYALLNPLKRQYQIAENFSFLKYLFLEILQRYYRLVTLGTLGTPGFSHRKQ